MNKILAAIILLFIVWTLTIMLSSCVYKLPDIRYCYKVYTQEQVIIFIADRDDIEFNGIDSVVVKAIMWNNWKCRDYDYSERSVK